MELAEARALVAARRARTPVGPMPPEPAAECALGPKLARYVCEHPDPDLTMLERMLELRDIGADAPTVGLEIFNACAPHGLRMTREAMDRACSRKPEEPKEQEPKEPKEPLKVD
jgi:hypothetical protein